MSTTQMTEGKIVQCIGAVIDIQFPRDNMPKIYEALLLADDSSPFAEKGLTFEVEQQRLVDVGHVVAGELDVDHRADALDDLAFGHLSRAHDCFLTRGV